MTLRHLKIFVNVCGHGSTTAAAQKMHISQSSVSLALSELENHYGQKLFDRISNRLHITETGKQLLQYAEHIVSLFDTMEKGARNWDAIGVMRVGASVTIGNRLLPDYVRDFNTEQPGIEIQAVIDNTAAIEQLVLKNDIDFGLVEGLVSSDCIVVRPFMEDVLVFICAPEHPWAKMEHISTEVFKKDAAATLILREKGSAVREVVERALNIFEIECRPSWQSISTQAIIRAVGKGLGVSALPHLLVEDSVKRGEVAVFQVEGIVLVRQFSVIHHKNKFLTKTAKNFIKAVCEG